MSTPNVNPFTTERNAVHGNMTRDDAYCDERKINQTPAVGGVADERVLKMGSVFHWVLSRCATPFNLNYIPETDMSHALGFVTINRTGTKGDTEADWWTKHRWNGILKGELRGNDGTEASGQRSAAMIYRGLTNAINTGPNTLLPFRFVRLRIPIDPDMSDKIAAAVGDYKPMQPGGAIFPYMENVDLERIGFSKEWVTEMRTEWEAEHSNGGTGHAPLWTKDNADILNRMIEAQKKLTYASLAYTASNLRAFDLSRLMEQFGIRNVSNDNLFGFLLTLLGDVYNLPGADAGSDANIFLMRQNADHDILRALAPRETDFGEFPEKAATLKACRDGAKMQARMCSRLRYHNTRSICGYNLTFSPPWEDHPTDLIVEHYV